MRKYGPTRGERIIRLCFSPIGLALIVIALVLHGIPTGPTIFEIGVMGGGFLGATAIWSVRKMTREP